MDNYVIGMYGEEAVSNYLDKIGCYIIARNYRTTKGEIDIIFQDGDFLVFGEVKSRTNRKYGIPCEAVDYKKRKQIIFVSKQFLCQSSKFDLKIRYDVFEVYIKDRKIRHIKDAFFEEMIL